MSVTKSVTSLLIGIAIDQGFINQDYVFLWWLPYRTEEVIAAIGDGGNIIYIDRKNQIVVL